LNTQAPPVATKIKIANIPENEYLYGLQSPRSESGESALTARSIISVSDLLTTDTKNMPLGTDFTPRATGKCLQVARFREEFRQPSPSGSASPMLHRACTPVTEIENDLPPVGEARYRL
jgi:hypothetical protein